MHFCTANILLAEDVRQVVARGRFNPISWPEIEVIRAIHGEASVTDVEVFVDVRQAAKDEKNRLIRIYGMPVVENVFPGRNPQMELQASNVDLDVVRKDTWGNPIDVEPGLLDLDPAIRQQRAAEAAAAVSVPVSPPEAAPAPAPDAAKKKEKVF